MAARNERGKKKDKKEMIMRKKSDQPTLSLSMVACKRRTFCASSYLGVALEACAMKRSMLSFNWVSET